MSEQEKKELKSQGFVIVEKMHIMIMTTIAVLTFLGGLAVYYAVGYAEKEKIKDQVVNHELRITEQEKAIKSFTKTQLEIKINLKALMQKQGIKFQTDEN